MEYRKKPVVIEAFQLPALDEDADAFNEWAARVEFDGYTSELDGRTHDEFPRGAA